MEQLSKNEMSKCFTLTAIVIMVTLICFLILQCKNVESYIFECSECETSCTSENATWGFLIISLPIVLFLQYMIDHEENVRQNRFMYLPPVPTLAQIPISPTTTFSAPTYLK